MIKSDKWIIKMAREYGMIEPFADSQIRKNAVSFGVSSYGYDLRVGEEFKILRETRCDFIDPKNFNSDAFWSFKTDNYILIPPNSFVLARSLEYFRIPRNVLTVCSGKSTYARCGVIVNVTPFEPEWEGYVTMSISNTAPVPVKIYANEGIAQVVFMESDEMCALSYADKKGKYQKQKEITLPKI